jgi:hypothetical protein
MTKHQLISLEPMSIEDPQKIAAQEAAAQPEPARESAEKGSDELKPDVERFKELAAEKPNEAVEQFGDVVEAETESAVADLTSSQAELTERASQTGREIPADAQAEFDDVKSQAEAAKSDEVAAIAEGKAQLAEALEGPPEPQADTQDTHADRSREENQQVYEQLLREQSIQEMGERVDAAMEQQDAETESDMEEPPAELGRMTPQEVQRLRRQVDEGDERPWMPVEGTEAEATAAAEEAARLLGSENAGDKRISPLDKVSADQLAGLAAATAERDPGKVIDSSQANEASGEINTDDQEGYEPVTPDQIIEELPIEQADAEAAAEGEPVILLTPEMRKDAKEQERHEAQVAAEKQALADKGQEIADLTAEIKRMGGLGGKIGRLVSPEQRAKLAAAQEKLSNLKTEYKGQRSEVVRGDVAALLNEQEAQIERLRTAMENGGGRLEKLGRAFYKGSKWLGEQNGEKLAKLLGKEPTSRLGKMMLRAASLRTAVGIGLLGAGFAMGIGTAGGAAALAAKRLSGSAFAGIGSYDLMKGVADRRADKFKPEELNDMSMEEVQDRMVKIQARAAAGGMAVKENPAYEQLSARLLEMAKAESEPNPEKDQDMLDTAMRRLGIENMMEGADSKLEERLKKDQRNDHILKGVAVGLGAVIGSGALAKGIGWASEQTGAGEAYRSIKDSLKDFLGIKGEAVPAAAGVAAPESAPAAATAEAAPAKPLTPEAQPDAPLTPEKAPAVPEQAPAAAGAAAAEGTPDAARLEKLKQLVGVRKGDSYTALIKRQLLADPKGFGYNPEVHGDDVSKWAGKTTSGILRDKGLVGNGVDTRLRYDPSGKSGVLLKPGANGKFDLVKLGNVKEYVHHEPKIDADQILKESVEATKKAMGAPTAVQEVIQDKYGGSAKGLIDQGVTREQLLKVANSPAYGGQEIKLTTPDGKSISLGQGIEAKFKALAALDQLDKAGAPTPSEQVGFKPKTPDWAKDGPSAGDAAPDAKPATAAAADKAPTAEASKDLFKGFYSDQQKGLGKSWIARGATKESLQALANAPARGGEWLTLKTADGGTIKVAGGFDAQRAAKAALEQFDATKGGAAAAAAADAAPDAKAPAAAAKPDTAPDAKAPAVAAKPETAPETKAPVETKGELKSANDVINTKTGSIKVVRTADGMSLESRSGLPDIRGIRGLLKDNYGAYTKDNDLTLDLTALENRAGDYLQLKEAHEQMVKSGLGDTPEAKFLNNTATDTLKGIKQDFGDVLR